MKEIIHYIIEKYDNKEKKNITITELSNLLYILEYSYFENNNKPIRNEIFKKANFKKYPEISLSKHLIELRDDLLKENKIMEIHDDIYVNSIINPKYNSSNPVEFKVIKEEEIITIDSIIESFSNG